MTISKEEYKRLRREFEGLKYTNRFKRFLERLLAEQEDKCAYCKKILYEFIDTGPVYNHPDLPPSRYAFKNYVYHIDHKIPLIKGGTNEFCNFAVACADCNLSKGAKYATA